MSSRHLTSVLCGNDPARAQCFVTAQALCTACLPVGLPRRGEQTGQQVDKDGGYVHRQSCLPLQSCYPPVCMVCTCFAGAIIEIAYYLTMMCMQVMLWLSTLGVQIMLPLALAGCLICEPSPLESVT